MRFCYHPDNVIYNTKGYMCTYADFIEEYPNVPLIEGEYFDYNSPTFVTINNEGHNLIQNPQDHQALIDNIESLGI